MYESGVCHDSDFRLIRVQVNEWLGRASRLQATDPKAIDAQLLELDAHLTLRSYIVGYSLTAADLALWGAIRGNRIAAATIKKGAIMNVTRWYKFVDESCPWISSAIQSANAQAQSKKTTKSAGGGSYGIGLPDTEKGVVTRFPPEPSSVLPRLVPAKAILIFLKRLLAYRARQSSPIE